MEVREKQQYEVIKSEKKEVVLDLPVEVFGRAKRIGTLARVRVPQEWLGKRVRCILEDDMDE
jgi:putative transposon-encoded protein